MKDNTFLLIVIALFFPFIAVGIKKGIGGEFLFNLILTFIFYFPGLIHAIWIITKK